MELSNFVNTVAVSPAAVTSASILAPAEAALRKLEVGLLRPATLEDDSLPAAASAASPPIPAPMAAAPAVASPAVPAFITTASLITVSGGTAAVTMLWQVSKVLVGKPAGSPWLGFFFSPMTGGAIYLLSIQDKKVQATLREKVIGAFIGFLNSMVLFSAAVGILGPH